MAVADGIITKDTTVFDLGCGKGDDLRFLKQRKIRCSGWDPYHLPKGKLVESDVVNLGYVLNVIDDPAERDETLRKAYALAKSVLVVSVRVDRALEGVEEFSDGCLTNTGTFQKIYDQGEFREYVQLTLGVRPYIAGLGIAYVFRDEAAEAAYIARRAFARNVEHRTELIEEFGSDKIARQYVRLANKLGRLPVVEEFKHFGSLLERFGSQQRVERLALAQIDKDKFSGSREQRRRDVLTYLAMLKLQAVAIPPLHELTPSLRGDIKNIWESYREAQLEAEAFLFSLGDPVRIDYACKSVEVGKIVNDDLYVHVTAENDLPELLRILIFAAQCIVGEIDRDLVKIKGDGRAVSFLKYENFDGDPHPPLRYSVRVHLPRASYKIRNYTKTANPPILHRKDTFVAPSYPHFETFRNLTEEEEKRGLLGRDDIGHQRGWEQLLESEGLRIEGHRLLTT